MYLPKLDNYRDLMHKASADLDRYKTHNGTYELMDCLLTLNAIPEWIRKNSTASPALISQAERAEAIMKDDSVVIDDKRIGHDLPQLLRLVKMLCNLRSIIRHMLLCQK